MKSTPARRDKSWDLDRCSVKLYKIAGGAAGTPSYWIRCQTEKGLVLGKFKNDNSVIF